MSEIVGNHKSDDLLVDLSELLSHTNSLPETKRSVLKVSARVFDPLGLLRSFVEIDI